MKAPYLVLISAGLLNAMSEEIKSFRTAKNEGDRIKKECGQYIDHRQRLCVTCDEGMEFVVVSDEKSDSECDDDTESSTSPSVSDASVKSVEFEKIDDTARASNVFQALLKAWPDPEKGDFVAVFKTPELKIYGKITKVLEDGKYEVDIGRRSCHPTNPEHEIQCLNKFRLFPLPKDGIKKDGIKKRIKLGRFLDEADIAKLPTIVRPRIVDPRNNPMISDNEALLDNLKKKYKTCPGKVIKEVKEGDDVFFTADKRTVTLATVISKVTQHPNLDIIEKSKEINYGGDIYTVRDNDGNEAVCTIFNIRTISSLLGDLYLHEQDNY